MHNQLESPTSTITAPLATGRVLFVRDDETIIELDQAVELHAGELVLVHAEARGTYARTDARAIATGVVVNMRRVRVARAWAHEGARCWLRRPSR